MSTTKRNTELKELTGQCHLPADLAEKFQVADVLIVYNTDHELMVAALNNATQMLITPNNFYVFRNTTQFKDYLTTGAEISNNMTQFLGFISEKQVKELFNDRKDDSDVTKG